MKLVQMADAVRYVRMTSAELRETFLLEGMFNLGKIEVAYVDLDRTVIGSAVPTGAALTLETQPELRAEYFLERRELGVLNVGGAGTVAVDGKTFELDKLDCLYVGRGSKSVSFASKSAGARSSTRRSRSERSSASSTSVSASRAAGPSRRSGESFIRRAPPPIDRARWRSSAPDPQGWRAHTTSPSWGTG